MIINDYKTTWRELITEECKKRGDKFESLSINIKEGGLDEEFDDGFGLEMGCHFTAWSDDWVYFPLSYDGEEWCGSVPRYPTSNVRMEHQGG